jgi:hypothetical protein
VSNQNYDQVPALVSQRLLFWDQDQIKALLMQGATYVGTHERVSQAGGAVVSMAPILGRWINEFGYFMGQPAVFQQVPDSQPFQVLVTQDDGRSDPRLLAFIDQDQNGSVIIVQRTGSLIVRPSQENPPVPPDMMEEPPIVGFWLRP